MARVMVKPQPQQAIVFAGSSILFFWSTLERDMAPLPVVNQAFAGARITAVLENLDTLVIPFAPRIVVYYCGGNDVNDGVGPQKVFDGFRSFVGRLHATLPATRVCYLSLNKAPQKLICWDKIDLINSMAESYCAHTTGLDYVDVNPVLVDADGQPRHDLFVADGLHLRPDAYAGFGRILKPVLVRIWRGFADSREGQSGE